MTVADPGPSDTARRSAYEIRVATPYDLTAVEALVHLAYSPFEQRIGRKPGPMLDDYAKLIKNHCVHVVDVAGLVQGLVVLIADAHGMLLDNVAVAPSAQGTGLGRALLLFAETVTLKRGFRSIRLYTNEAMTENIALYTRNGYAETHRGEERGLRRVFMSKQLK